MAQKLKSVKIGHCVYGVNRDIGYFPYFTMTLRHRINQKMAVNVAVVGEAGVGKSYMAFTFCRELDKNFSVDQIVFTYKDYMDCLQNLKPGKPIMFDEPSYSLSKRDWYRQINKVLVKTLESQRFMLHPLFLPIINVTLLDKTVRDHLVQFVVHVLRRGYAYAYRIESSQWEEKVYRHQIAIIKHDKELILGGCPRLSCLGCRKLSDCGTFRAQYERKKMKVQLQRYEQAEAEASQLEVKDLTDTQLENMIKVFKEEITDEDGRLDAKLIRIVFLRKLKMKIGYNKSYTIKKMLEYDYPEEFGEQVETVE